MTKRVPAELESAIRSAASAAYGCDPDEIFVEIEERHLTRDGRKSVLVNWQQSQKASSQVRAAVKEAVRAALLPPYDDYHVTLL